MSFDGIVTRSVVNELRTSLLGGRIDKIYQQENDEILISIYNKSKTYKLLISASSNNPRIYLTDYAKKNPVTPPVFCMLLRKHLSGSIILNIEQYCMDRVVIIDTSSMDELGLPTENRLVVEIMGKHSNIILINKDKNIILDSIKRVSEDMSRIRQILPGLNYEYPPSQDKADPLNTTKEEFIYLINRDKEGIRLYKFFYTTYTGLSPLLSKEICFRANLDIDRTIGSIDLTEKERLYHIFDEIMSYVKRDNYNPQYIDNDNDERIAFYCLDLFQFNTKNKHFLSSISHVLDNTYRRLDIQDRLKQKSHSMRKTIQVRLDRAKKKLAKQKQEMLQSRDREKYKVYADIISANIHLIPKGEEHVELKNFYDENLSLIDIPLDNKISPILNAQRYYKKYSKLKNAEKLLINQIPETKNEIMYLESVLISIDNSSEVEDFDEIKIELIKEGYLRDTSRNKKKRKNKKETLSSPYLFLSTDDFKIYVGKNNRQNEHLTLKTASREDIWLHVQNMPGSHVIIKKNNKHIPDTTLREAAILAAYFSKAKDGKNILVDYTERKNVRKQSGAKPGLVIYENYKTISVNPDIEIIKTLQKGNGN